MKHRAAENLMSDLSPGRRWLIVLAGIVQVTLAGSAWLDLLRRPASEVRGPKPGWAAVIAVNYIGPLAYFRWGRRPGTTGPDLPTASSPAPSVADAERADLPDEWGRQSFPASDPPQNW